MADISKADGYIRIRYHDMGVPLGETEPVFALYMSPAHLRPLGHTTVSLSTSQALPTIPTGAQTVLLRGDAKWFWTDDGQTPTAGVGQYLLADEPLWYDGDLAAFKMFAPSTVDLRVAYYS